jgi:hypothetical protein
MARRAPPPHPTKSGYAIRSNRRFVQEASNQSATAWLESSSFISVFAFSAFDVSFVASLCAVAFRDETEIEICIRLALEAAVSLGIFYGQNWACEEVFLVFGLGSFLVNA